MFASLKREPKEETILSLSSLFDYLPQSNTQVGQFHPKLTWRNSSSLYNMIPLNYIIVFLFSVVFCLMAICLYKFSNFKVWIESHFFVVHPRCKVINKHKTAIRAEKSGIRIKADEIHN